MLNIATYVGLAPMWQQYPLPGINTCVEYSLETRRCHYQGHLLQRCRPCPCLGRVPAEADTHLFFSTCGKEVPSQTSRVAQGEVL